LQFKANVGGFPRPDASQAPRAKQYFCSSKPT
jgi:hypothetical protein